MKYLFDFFRVFNFQPNHNNTGSLNPFCWVLSASYSCQVAVQNLRFTQFSIPLFTPCTIHFETKSKETDFVLSMIKSSPFFPCNLQWNPLNS